MAKITYASLKLKRNTEVKTFNFNEKEIEVVQYLPIEDKYELIMTTINSSQPDGYFNDIMLDMMFHLNIIFYYTNITFTDKQKEDIPKLFDTLQSCGLMAEVLKNMDEDEYKYLYDSLMSVRAANEAYDKSIAGVVRTLGNQLASNTDGLKAIVEAINPDNFEIISELANAFGIDRETIDKKDKLTVVK